MLVTAAAALNVQKGSKIVDRNQKKNRNKDKNKHIITRKSNRGIFTKMPSSVKGKRNNHKYRSVKSYQTYQSQSQQLHFHVQFQLTVPATNVRSANQLPMMGLPRKRKNSKTPEACKSDSTIKCNYR